MERELAEKVIATLVKVSVDVYVPVDGVRPDVSDAKWEELKALVLGVWSSGFDAMMPIVRQYPELDPDRGDRRPDARDQIATTDVTPPTLSRRERGEALVSASSAALADLRQVTQQLADSPAFDDRHDLVTRLNELQQAVERMQALGVEWRRI